MVVQADSLDDDELAGRKREMGRLAAEEDLPLYAFPEAVLRRAHEAVHDAPGLQERFEMPFTVVAGREVDPAVSDLWFVRKYKCAPPGCMTCGLCVRTSACCVLRALLPRLADCDPDMLRRHVTQHADQQLAVAVG